MQATELYDFFDPNELARFPGVYVAASDSEAYGPLLAMITAGLAVDEGENIEPRGVKIQAARVGERRNPAIGISREFFTTVLKDYEDWRQKWWREAVQNSVDAGAKRIQCKLKVNPDGTYTASSEDDGGGMDEDVLINKFLMLGGTTKQLGTGAAGGFGKAKELLILPWLSWSIHTRDRKVTGSGIDYTVQDAPFLRGTRVEVVMPADQHTSAAAAIAFIEKSYLPNVRFSVEETNAEGEVERWTPRAKLKGKELIDEVPGKANFYLTKVNYEPYTMLVRVHGIYMFEIYVGKTPKQQVIVEITAPSIEILTANRDGFRDRDVKRSIDDLGERIAKDVMSTFRSKRGILRQKYEGRGKFQVARMQAGALAHIGPIARTKKGDVEMNSEDVAVVSDVVEEYRQAEEATTGKAPALPNKDLASELLTSVTFKGAHHVEEAVKQLVWDPDFFLINEIDDFRVPRKFKPETMKPRIVKLSRTWTELCRYVLMQLGEFRQFGVGFLFSTSSAAAYLYEDGEHWLLLNPYKDLYERKQTWSPTKPEDLKWLYAAAVHECTHLADGISYHDESFAAALTMNIAKTADGFRKVRKIVNSIRMREVAVADVPRAMAVANPRVHGAERADSFQATPAPAIKKLKTKLLR